MTLMRWLLVFDRGGGTHVAVAGVDSGLRVTTVVRVVGGGGRRILGWCVPSSRLMLRGSTVGCMVRR